MSEPCESIPDKEVLLKLVQWTTEKILVVHDTMNVINQRRFNDNADWVDLRRQLSEQKEKLLRLMEQKDDYDRMLALHDDFIDFGRGLPLFGCECD